MRLRSSLAASAAALAVCAAASTAIGGSIPQAGGPAPNFSLQLIANGSGTVTPGTYHGKGLYLNFFASWCIPCKEEVPWIATLSKQYAKRGVVVVGVDELESLSAAKGFVAKFKLPYPIGLDDSEAVGASYGLIGLPMHVFIGADGKLVKRVPGEMSQDQIRAALDQIAHR